ncbi:FAD-dependent oxidoreductase [Bdellovibrio svalbardensis]|uniref:NAD(P)/FAD-dependent oxidoreductase n=1 Tax=Bdellovibrio svalbardensis TaxID=2972972 RepID=A0ABT6DEU4_9BACT|nr:FAD-dependent oxidoreductase [Bdellovibrio svalbardensis]MDG0815049.1 NAD(P)/FAD-dependent oxidoreductase [Bdellovibrio svalbardensis]
MAQHIYDYAIIGSGLTGLSIAAALSRETSNIALLDGADVAGGANRQINFPTGPINNGLRFVPDSVLSEKALRFLETLLDTKIASDVSEEAPITYEAGGFKTFLGFGENPPAFYEELNYFTSSKKIDLAVEPHQWTPLLLQKFKGDFLPRSYVTKFHQEGEKVTHLTINGSKTLYAHNFIFAGTVKDLALLLPEDAISIRARSKLSKNTYWTALCLDICHSKAVTDATTMHVLNGTTQDEIGPCTGRFLPAVEVEGQTLQASQWMTFIESELTEDSEVVGLTLKKIKRQIKRAYPEALNDIKLERIFVAPIVAGNGDIKLSANMTVPSLENLWIASATVNEQKNLVGSLLQAEMIVASLGFKVDDLHTNQVAEDVSADHGSELEEASM